MTTAETITIAASVVTMGSSAISIIVGMYVKSIIGPITERIKALEASDKMQSNEAMAKWKKIGELGERVSKLEGARYNHA